MNDSIDRSRPELVEEERFFSKIERYKRMLDYTKHLRDAKRDLSKEFFKSLWTFSSGAMALSVTLVSGIFGSEFKEAHLFLFASWLCFTVCILSTMLSVHASQKAYKMEIDDISNDMAARREIGAESPECRKWCNIAGRLETLAFVFFILGIVTLLMFVLMNIVGSK